MKDITVTRIIISFWAFSGLGVLGYLLSYAVGAPEIAGWFSIPGAICSLLALFLRPTLFVLKEFKKAWLVKIIRNNLPARYSLIKDVAY